MGGARPDEEALPLRGKLALVTGGAGGIGSAICHLLAREGAHLLITYHQRADRADALIAELPGHGHAALRLSVRDKADIDAAAQAVATAHGRLDILVNNAGTTRVVPHADLDALDDALIDDIFATNWRGAFGMVRAFRPLLEAAGAGVVVNISSIAGNTAVGSNIAYCASKAAMDNMTKSLARALAPKIRVVSVAPGWVMGDYARSADPAYLQRQRELTPLGRIAEADDVARAVYAAVALLGFTNGAIIPVDGGRPLN
jgi:3-oxoacyl-[acyl-carrier protein] reductase